MTMDAFEQEDGFEALSKAVQPFGWEVTEQFASEYHRNVWVYSLANALVSVTAENNALRAAAVVDTGEAQK